MSSKNVILMNTAGDQIYPATTAEQVAYDAETNVKQAIDRQSGHATVANAAADMVDQTAIYVYTGSETGYTFGHWYYYDGSDWSDGGVYLNGTDNTLSVAGMAADAKATGDALESLELKISQAGSGLSDEAKIALLDCFAHVAWIDEYGQTYYDALETALYEGEEKTLVSIFAAFNQGSAVIYTDSALNDLKPYLTVTASYSDGTTQIVTDYTLSGTLVAGTSTITVAYGGKTVTFNVTVTQAKRYITQSDIASHIGIDTVSVANGTIGESNPATFSGVIFEQTITKMWFTLHTHLDSRRRPRYIFRKDADGSFYAIDENTTSPKLYKFTLDTGGTKYNATQISDISTITTFTKTGDYFSTLKKEMTLSNGILTIADEESSVSFTNANCFGYWQAAYNNNINAGMFDNCEV